MCNEVLDLLAPVNKEERDCELLQIERIEDELKYEN
jgi:uncharacterized protein YihD (DUF1040 family)